MWVNWVFVFIVQQVRTIKSNQQGNNEKRNADVWSWPHACKLDTVTLVLINSNNDSSNDKTDDDSADDGSHYQHYLELVLNFDKKFGRL